MRTSACSPVTLGPFPPLSCPGRPVWVHCSKELSQGHGRKQGGKMGVPFPGSLQAGCVPSPRVRAPARQPCPLCCPPRALGTSSSLAPSGLVSGRAPCCHLCKGCLPARSSPTIYIQRKSPGYHFVICPQVPWKRYLFNM
jgi:hypothetical protein